MTKLMKKWRSSLSDTVEFINKCIYSFIYILKTKDNQYSQVGVIYIYINYLFINRKLNQ